MIFLSCDFVSQEFRRGSAGQFSLRVSYSCCQMSAGAGPPKRLPHMAGSWSLAMSLASVVDKSPMHGLSSMQFQGSWMSYMTVEFLQSECPKRARQKM